mmetsp:Transcript_175/g.513  ORF Transcript_175/g.513 Transcript_175/m.513 type:complete len:355 (-) Transcript_175:199-1263(-)|eukprot:CAMPEP_0168181486 /NCGR_PEP_ID=MMETSP0139_2-20121125/11254_1 /TAXON_ID=44445 /ORGANISM="Pseudo-nitzschia australis, Strain 10249 10 AB" /LENGTH=354 /DNA_ID=CAMNT_0008102089 /DNA_START=166 /DNA_END=1230 /DNA_ORIENTATION=-
MGFFSSADTKALVLGSAAIGFAPFFCLFFQIVFPKPQLLIVSIAAAFFYLLAASAASLCWYILDPTIGLETAWSAIIPGVFFQFIFRCLFVTTYHKVENVIEASIEMSEEEEREHQRQSGSSSSGSNNNNRCDDDRQSSVQIAKNKLSLNDASCGIAAGVGFGGLHAILMFGSLLASETYDSGVLYQPSCPKIPSLMVSALITFCFFFLDMFWMLFTFFGMRRRVLFPRGGGTLSDINPLSRPFGHYFGNTRMGGNQALLTILITHLAAAGFTTFNVFQYGCVFSLTTIPVLTIVVAYVFWSGVSKIYIPLPHSNVRLSLPASYSYGSHVGEGVLGGDGDDALDHTAQPLQSDE